MCAALLVSPNSYSDLLPPTDRVELADFSSVFPPPRRPGKNLPAPSNHQPPRRRALPHFISGLKGRLSRLHLLTGRSGCALPVTSKPTISCLTASPRRLYQPY